VANANETAVYLPSELVQKAQEYSSAHNISLVHLFEQALAQYIGLYHNMELRECMQSGYSEMASINLELAQ